MKHEPAVSVRGLTKKFGALIAVNNISLDVHAGELIGLLGPNGSGKTTLLNLMSGLLPIDVGEIALEGTKISGMTQDQIVRTGVARMFQLTRVFYEMSALENLLTVGFALGFRRAAALERARFLLSELKLDHLADLRAGSLSGGQQKLLEFGCCFVKTPKIALLDEPFAAIHPIMRETMATFIRKANAGGQTFIIVSHDMPIVVDLCKRSICLTNGQVIADGPTLSVVREPAVIESYLGPHVP
jgi:branched-chain amino acid transport system ATP-binding protein